MKGDFERYLSAKETVDDRALDRRVLGRVREDLRAAASPRVLEAGAGTAAFCRRLLGWDDLPDCTYVAVDTDADLLATGRERVLDRARAVGFEARAVDPSRADLDLPLDDPGLTHVAALRLRGPARIDVHLVAGDALTVATRGRWEFVVAQAFADLLTPVGLERLVSGLDRGGVYLPITFDGGTAFVPSHPDDDAVVDAYHATMVDDSGERLGATAGRRLLTLLPELGVGLDAVGGSDWVVSPLDGAYPADESYFVRVVVDTVADAVDGHVAPETVETWLETRRREWEENRLHFVARNLDLYGRVG
jgi:SAM-dependent methyltransferase